MKKIKFIILFITFSLMSKLNAQCSASFTYTIGSNGTVSFASNSTGTTNSTHFLWSSSNSFISFNYYSPSFTHSFTTNKTYTINLSIIDSSFSQPCISNTTQTLTINTVICNSNTIPFTYLNGLGAIGEVYFNYSPNMISSTPNFTMDMGDGTIYNTPVLSHTYQNLGTYPVTIFLTDPLGICAQSVSTLVHVVSCNLNVAFTYSIGSNGLTTFSNTSTGVTSSNPQYYWTIINGFNAVYNFNSTPTYTSNLTQNGTYTVQLQVNDTTPTLRCNSIATQTLIINNAPCSLAPITISCTQSGLVGNVSINYSSNTFATPNFTLNMGDGTIYNTKQTTHQYPGLGTYTVTLLTKDALGICTQSATQIVNILPCPITANFTYTVGNNGSVNFTSLVSGAISPSYYWSFGDGSVSYSANPSRTYFTSGIYTVTLLVSDTLNIVCTALATQTINLNTPCFTNTSFGVNKDFSALPAIVWNAYPNYPSNITGATWNWGDGSSSNTLYPSHTYSATGLYNICLTITVSCGATANYCFASNIYKTSNSNSNAVSSVNVINAAAAVSIKENISENKSLSLFPNPNNGEFSIQLDKTNTLPHQLLIYNVLGKLIFEDSFIPNEAKHSIQLSAIENGTYFVVLKSEQTVYRSKFSVNK
jgi:PKD repeat protein